MISRASLRVVISVVVDHGDFIFYVVERPTFVFPPLSDTPSFSTYTNVLSKGNVPTPEEWRTLWSAWDLITLKMIPEGMVHQKPIDLRHKCLFYIGHIPTYVTGCIHYADSQV
jgi:hypothetical protein